MSTGPDLVWAVSTKSWYVPRGAPRSYYDHRLVKKTRFNSRVRAMIMELWNTVTDRWCWEYTHRSVIVIGPGAPTTYGLSPVIWFSYYCLKRGQMDGLWHLPNLPNVTSTEHMNLNTCLRSWEITTTATIIIITITINITANTTTTLIINDNFGAQIWRQ